MYNDSFGEGFTITKGRSIELCDNSDYSRIDLKALLTDEGITIITIMNRDDPYEYVGRIYIGDPSAVKALGEWLVQSAEEMLSIEERAES